MYKWTRYIVCELQIPEQMGHQFISNKYLLINKWLGLYICELYTYLCMCI